jgi:hypothetical protein
MMADDEKIFLENKQKRGENILLWAQIGYS